MFPPPVQSIVTKNSVTTSTHQPRSLVSSVVFLALITLSSGSNADTLIWGQDTTSTKPYTTTKGVYVNDGSFAVSWANSELTIDADLVEIKAQYQALKATQKSANVTILSNSSIKLEAGSEIQAEKNPSGIYLELGATAKLDGTDIDIRAIGTDNVTARGIFLTQQKNFESLHSKVEIGSENTQKITISATGNANSYGISNIGGAVTLTANEVTINSSGIGIHVGNNTESSTIPKDTAKTIINANRTTINADGYGILSFSNGVTEISGDLKVNAPIAIAARGHSSTSINANGDATVVINGDISFETPGSAHNSGNVIDADISLNLSGEASSWTGNVTKEVPEGHSKEDSTVSGLKVALSNGAQWNPTKINTANSDYDGTTLVKSAEKLDHLTLNQGVINIKNTDQTVEVEEISGTGGTINLNTTINQENGTISSGKFVAESVDTSDGTPTLSVYFTNVTSDKVGPEAFTALADSVSADGATQIRTIAQGAVKGALVETIDKNGNSLGVTQYQNTRLGAYGSIAALGVLQWRHDMNDLTKRMGELRTSPASVGTWARLYGSEQEYGKQSVTAKNTSIQVGADYDVGAGWKVGAAFTYTDGSATYDLGNSDNKSYGLALYGSWFAENGQFVDLIAKYSRLDTDFNLEGMDGSFDNNAYSFSVEYGWNFRLGDLAFIEPQAELTYGMVSGDTFDTNNDVRIEQDDFESLVGRIGVRSGFVFPENKGTIYARVSVLHDFKGDLDSNAYLISDSRVSDPVHDDLGGTWYEFGIGANFNLTDRTYTYVDLEKNTGGEVQENWRWNIGLRHVW